MKLLVSGLEFEASVPFEIRSYLGIFLYLLLLKFLKRYIPPDDRVRKEC